MGGWALQLAKVQTFAMGSTYKIPPDSCCAAVCKLIFHLTCIDYIGKCFIINTIINVLKYKFEILFFFFLPSSFLLKKNKSYNR